MEQKSDLIPMIARSSLGILIALGLTPQGALWFESTMVAHMLVQFPLLIVLGFITFEPQAKRNAFFIRADPFGVIAFIGFTGWMLFWMMPLNLDLATIEPEIRALKLISVPIGIGWSLRWLWHQASTVLKCVAVFEIWASITRLGWLYVESPQQLCSSYLIGEQQQVGNILLVISAIGGSILITYSLFGTFNKNTSNTLVKLTGKVYYR